MNIFGIKTKKEKLIETYKNNYEMMLKRKNDYYNKNIQLQKQIIESNEELSKLKSENRKLKKELKETQKSLTSKLNIEVPSIEKGNKIIEEHFKKQKKTTTRKKKTKEVKDEQ